PVLSSSTTRPPPRSTLFPYTTLFRSERFLDALHVLDDLLARHHIRISTVHVEQGKLVTGLEPVEAAVSGNGDPIVEAEGVEHRRSEEHTSELQSRENLVCRLLLEKKK